MKKSVLLAAMLWTALLAPPLDSVQALTPPTTITAAEKEALRQKEAELEQRAPLLFDPATFTPQQLADLTWILNYSLPQEDALYGKPLLTVTAVTVDDGTVVIHLEPTPDNPILQAQSETDGANMIYSQITNWQNLRFRYRWLIHLHYLPVTPTTIRLETTAHIYAKPTDMEYIYGMASGLIVPPKKKIQVMTNLQWPGLANLHP